MGESEKTQMAWPYLKTKESAWQRTPDQASRQAHLRTPQRGGPTYGHRRGHQLAKPGKTGYEQRPMEERSLCNALQSAWQTMDLIKGTS